MAVAATFRPPLALSIPHGRGRLRELYQNEIVAPYRAADAKTLI